jgi:hypothetical protein
LKVRSGFVSNSSSSSFIIHWDIHDNEFDKKNIKKAVILILDADNSVCYFDNDYDKAVETGVGLSLDNKMLQLANYVTQNTKYIEGRGYETIFWASMTNDFRSYGEEAMQFVAALTFFNILSDNKVLDNVDYDIDFDH